MLSKTDDVSHLSHFCSGTVYPAWFNLVLYSQISLKYVVEIWLEKHKCILSIRTFCKVIRFISIKILTVPVSLLSKRPSSFCLIHFVDTWGAARG